MNLLYSLLGHTQTQELLEALNIVHLVIAVDANIMLKDVPRYQRTSKATGLLTALQSPLVTVTMSSEDIAEVHLHLERRCKGDLALLEQMRAVWSSEYVPYIRVFDVSRVPLNPRAKRLRVTDPDDLSLAQQSQLVAADHLITDDPHLEEFAPADKEWSQLAAAVHTITVQQGVLVQIVGTNLTLTVTVGVGAAVIFDLLKTVFTLALSVLRRVPPLVVLFGLLAVAGMLLQPQRRKALLQLVRQLPSSVMRFFDEFLAPIVADQTQATRLALQALQPAREYQQAKRTPDLLDTTVRGFAARVLARNRNALTLEQLLKAMHQVGYRSRTSSPQTYLRRVLRKHPEMFDCDDRQRWSLRWAVGLTEMSGKNGLEQAQVA